MDVFDVAYVACLAVIAVAILLWTREANKPSPEPSTKEPSIPDAEHTVVHLRSIGVTPAKFMESRVHYDAWGEPYVYGDAFHGDWMTNTLRPKGNTGSKWLQWKHKSGPDVVFPDSTAPDKGWFPKGVER